MGEILLIFIILLNLVCYKYLNKPVKKELKAIKNERKRIIKYNVCCINIANIIVNLLYFIFCYFNNIIISLILFLIACYSFIMILNLKISVNTKKYISNYNNEFQDIFNILRNTIITALIIQRFSSIKYISNIQIFGFISIAIIFVAIILNLINIVKLVMLNKDDVVFESKEKDCVTDINFINKYELKNVITYIFVLTFYIVSSIIQFEYQIVLYLIIAVLLVIIIGNKFRKICKQGQKLSTNISILNNKPGVKYAFDYYRDILLLKKLVVGWGCYIFSLLSIYMSTLQNSVGVTTGLYCLLIYTIINDKFKLIKYIRSLNNDFISNDKYKVVNEYKYDYINKITINVFDYKFDMYEFVYISENNIIYTSNKILYDPELYTDSIIVHANATDLNDYIVELQDLYN